MTDKAEFDERDLVKLTTVSNPVEAQVLEGLLQDREIRCFVRTWHSHAYDGIFTPQKGYAEVKVFKDELEAAKTVLEDFKRSLDQAPPEDAEPGSGESTRS